MHINVYGDDMRNSVQAERKVGADGTTYRGVRLNLTNGDAITFWLDDGITLQIALAEMTDQARLLKEEANARNH